MSDFAGFEAFDATTVPDAPSAEALPAGDYTVMVTETDFRPTNKTQPDGTPTGSYLSATFQVVEGEHSGRNLYEMYNIVNLNPKAVAIGKEQLRDLCLACNMNAIVLPSDLNDKVLRVRVACKNDTYNGETRVKNTIKKYAPLSAATTPTPPMDNGAPF